MHLGRTNFDVEAELNRLMHEIEEIITQTR